MHRPQKKLKKDTLFSLFDFLGFIRDPNKHFFIKK